MQQLSEWQRCSEGFISVKDSNSLSDVSKKKRKKPAICKDKKTDRNIIISSFDLEKNSGEKLGEGIIWSSSESEDEEGQEQPVVQRKTKRSRPLTHKPRNERSFSLKSQSNVNLKEIDADEVTVDDSEDDSSSVIPYQNYQNPSQPESGKTLEGDIDDYDSDSGRTDAMESDMKSLIAGKELEIVVEEEIDISQALTTSSSSLSPVSQQTGCGLRAGDWVKTLHLKTPTKSDQGQHTNQNLEDSAKKKSKSTRGGLAEQLSRIQSRDKTSARVWSHQYSKQELSQDTESSSVVLRVLGFELLYSLQFARCDYISGSVGQGQQRSQRLVMFPSTQVEQLGLTPGTVILIAPPWQHLELHNGEQVLLCTKHCKILKQTSGDSDSSLLDAEGANTGLSLNTTISREPVMVKTRWACPCVLGLCRNHSVCPAYKFPCLSGLIHQQIPGTSTDSCVKGDNPGHSTGSLHTVDRTGSHTPRVHDSVLECMEEGSGDGPGTSRNVMCFRGSILRACHWQSQGKKVWKLLVEDCHGNVCQIVLSEEDTEKCGCRDLGVCEGMLFLFSGLAVHSRILRENDPALFSLIDRHWSCIGHLAVSQDSEDTVSDQNTKSARPAPSFCYSLQPDVTCQAGFQLRPSQHPSGAQSRSNTLIRLNQLKQMEKMRFMRCSMLVRVLHSIKKDVTTTTTHSEDDAVDQIFYITDRSLDKGTYLQLCVLRSCVLTLTHQPSKQPTLLQLLDVCYREGEMSADGYSRLTQVTDHSSQGQEDDLTLTFSLPVATGDVSALSLCQITGTISEVDESLAYSWDACPFCDSERLVPSDNHVEGGPMSCLSCKRSKVTPVNRMKMVIIVCCSTLKKSRVKIDLLQKTIEKLLPESEEPEDGYELSSVLNKSVGPLSCFVVSSEIKDGIQEIILNEINI